MNQFAALQSSRAFHLACRTASDDICAMCAEDSPRYATWVHGVPVRVCDRSCQDALIATWSMEYTGPKDSIARKVFNWMRGL